MDSHLASVLISGNLDVQNGSQCAEGTKPLTEVFLEPNEKTSSGTAPGNLQPCPMKAAVTIRQDALSINGKKPEVGGTSEPALQEESKTGGIRQPITVKPGVPVLPSQPIRLKFIVPPQCKRPITNSAISLTKDFAYRGPVSVSSGGTIRDADGNKIQISALSSEGETKKVTQKTEDIKHESFQEDEEEGCEKMCIDGDSLSAEVHSDELETPLFSSHKSLKIPSQQRLKGETTERNTDESVPITFQEIDLQPCETFEGDLEEQTVPLDLSLPKKRESQERKCGHLLDDSGCESLLIMEVDEYEGEGDRDVVEEDEDDFVLHVDGTSTLEDCLLSPSVITTSVLPSLSLREDDVENLLLIDDQGIPYTLSPDGLRVPQVDVPPLEDPQSEQNGSTEVEGQGSTPSPSLADRDLSPRPDNALRAASEELSSSEAHVTDSPSVVDKTQTLELFASVTTNSDPSKAAELSVQSGQANALSLTSQITVPSQPIQLFSHPSPNTPILLLSSSSSPSLLSSGSVGLTLPLPVTQTPPSSSTPMFLLLSSVPSSSGDSVSTSTPIAVLDPSTGQLAQIAGASMPVSLPLSSHQMSGLGSPLPTVSHPIIRLSPNSPPVILPGVNSDTPDSVLTSRLTSSSSPALQNEIPSGTISLHRSENNSSDLNSGNKAITEAEEVSDENNKPLSSTASSPHIVQSTSDAQSHDMSDMHTQHLPLDDHLYFSNPAASPSPPIAPIPSSDKLKPLDPLDPLTPVGSPNAMGPRRVLYCQLCPRVFFYLSDLERHAITHSQKKPHVCQQCGKAFKRSSHLQVSCSSVSLTSARTHVISIHYN